MTYNKNKGILKIKKKIIYNIYFSFLVQWYFMFSTLNQLQDNQSSLILTNKKSMTERSSNIFLILNRLKFLNKLFPSITFGFKG